MIALITQLLWLGACSPDVADSGSYPAPYTQRTTWHDTQPGTAFGSSLAADSKGAWVGVPEDAYGRVDRIEAGEVRNVIEGAAQNGAGSRLAWSAELGMALGAPLINDGAGQVLDEQGATIRDGLPGEGLGSAIFGGEEGWLIGGNSRIVGGGFDLSPPGRPRALAVFDGRVVAGISQIRDGIWIEGQLLQSAGEGSLAGYAMCVGDVDGDQEDELVIGAPGTNQVHVLDSIPSDGSLDQHARTYSASGHFGWSLACRKGEFWVGAPLYGAEHRGAVFRIRAGDPAEELSDPWFTGALPGSQMGFALAGGPAAEVWIGSPGKEDLLGRVDCAY